jgi:hypothetical protein
MPDKLNSICAADGPPKDIDRHRHHDYSTLLIGGRRKAALPIGTPAINRHLAFWIPDDPTLKRDQWIEHIEDFFVALYRQLEKTPGVTPTTPQKKDETERLHLIHNSYPTKEGDGGCVCIKGAKEQPSRYQRLLLSFLWQFMPVDLTLEVFDEYFTLSTTIDLSRCNAVPTSGLANSQRLVLEDAIKSFNSAVAKRHRKIGISKELKEPYRDIYYTVWEKLYKDIVAKPLETHADNLGKFFADFRSFVACRGREHFIANGDEGTAQQPLEKAIGKKLFQGRNATRCADKVFSFMTADAWLDWAPGENGGTEIQEPREFTVTPVLDNRCIYASALGVPPSHLQDKDQPLTFMLLSANHCPSELGLLLDGFNVLGTTRLAALHDFPHLTKAALQLRELEARISTHRPSMTQRHKQIAESLPYFSQSLAEIEQGIKVDDDDKHRDKNKIKLPQIVGGLPFRVERSQYYQKQFGGLVEGLRIGRIEGFLTYSESVARRLGGTYDLINTVGLRDQRLHEMLTTLDRRVQSFRTYELQSAITDATQQIKGFQKLAEIAIFLGLFPDAVSNLVAKLFGNNTAWEFMSVFVSLVIGGGFILRKELKQAVNKLVEMAFKAYAKRRFAQHSSERPRRTKMFFPKARRKLYWRMMRKLVVLRREYTATPRMLIPD